MPPLLKCERRGSQKPSFLKSRRRGTTIWLTRRRDAIAESSPRLLKCRRRGTRTGFTQPVGVGSFYCDVIFAHKNVTDLPRPQRVAPASSSPEAAESLERHATATPCSFTMTQSLVGKAEGVEIFSPLM